ncbi:MAG: glycoside hydrolase family 18 protein [Pyrinomonadaceae bacterium]
MSDRRSSFARRSFHVVFVFFVLIGTYDVARPKVSVAKQPKFMIIGYVFNRANIHDISAEKLTHINYAFALVSKDGEIVLNNPEAPARLSQLQALKARNPSLKIILSVGGWGADNFSDAALSDTSRERFANSAVGLIKRYALDGIDLDWEYPGQPGPGIKYRPEDKENFTYLLKTVRQHINALSNERSRRSTDRYTLTIASAAGDYFKHTEMDKLHVYLDWINIMAYDFYTSSARTTGHHTGLSRSLSGGSSNEYGEASVKQHLDAGIPSRKLVLGTAFYGRSFSGVKLENNGLYQPYERYAGEHSYSALTRDFINKQGFKRLWDNAAKAPYLWNAESGTFITYDDPDSLKAKAEFVKSHRLGGLMYWEHSHDPAEILLSTIFAHLR